MMDKLNSFNRMQRLKEGILKSAERLQSKQDMAITEVEDIWNFIFDLSIFPVWQVAMATTITTPKFISAECGECGAAIERKADEKPCPKCSGYFHKGDCYRNHVEKQHRY